MRTRITIQTTEEFDRTLEEIRLATGRTTKSEVIRDGLELYDLVLQHLRDGKHLYLGMARESAGEVLLPHLERAAGRLGRPLAAMKSDGASPQLSVVPTQGVESAPEDEAQRTAATHSNATKRRSESP